MPTVDEQGQQRYFQRVITPRPLDCGLGPLPRAGVFAWGMSTKPRRAARPGLSMPRRSRSLGDRAVAAMAPTASSICPVQRPPSNVGSLS